MGVVSWLLICVPCHKLRRATTHVCTSYMHTSVASPGNGAVAMLETASRSFATVQSASAPVDTASMHTSDLPRAAHDSRESTHTQTTATDSRTTN